MRATPAMPGRHGRIWNVDGSGCATMSASCTRARSRRSPSRRSRRLSRERLRQLLRRDRERLQEPEDVGEPQPDEPDLALLGRPDDERANVVVHPSSLSSSISASIRVVLPSHERRRGRFSRMNRRLRTGYGWPAGDRRERVGARSISAWASSAVRCFADEATHRARVVSSLTAIWSMGGSPSSCNTPEGRRRPASPRGGRRVRPRGALPAERYRRDARARPPRGRLRDRGTASGTPSGTRSCTSVTACAPCGMRSRWVRTISTPRRPCSPRGSWPAIRARQRTWPPVRSVDGGNARPRCSWRDRRPRRAAAREGGRQRVPSGARSEGGPRWPRDVHALRWAGGGARGPVR